MEDVPVFHQKQRPPLARPGDLGGDLPPRTKASDSGIDAGLTPSPDIDNFEDEVKCSCFKMSVHRMWRELMVQEI